MSIFAPGAARLLLSHCSNNNLNTTTKSNSSVVLQVVDVRVVDVLGLHNLNSSNCSRENQTQNNINNDNNRKYYRLALSDGQEFVIVILPHDLRENQNIDLDSLWYQIVKVTRWERVIPEGCNRSVTRLRQFEILQSNTNHSQQEGGDHEKHVKLNSKINNNCVLNWPISEHSQLEPAENFYPALTLSNPVLIPTTQVNNSFFCPTQQITLESQSTTKFKNQFSNFNSNFPASSQEVSCAKMYQNQNQNPFQQQGMQQQGQQQGQPNPYQQLAASQQCGNDQQQQAPLYPQLNQPGQAQQPLGQQQQMFSNLPSVPQQPQQQQQQQQHFQQNQQPFEQQVHSSFGNFEFI